jgi:hypothetical protein
MTHRDMRSSLRKLKGPLGGLTARTIMAHDSLVFDTHDNPTHRHPAHRVDLFAGKRSFSANVPAGEK